jgi:hypothetical protein
LKKLSILIPVYNEEKTIIPVLEARYWARLMQANTQHAFTIMRKTRAKAPL